MQQAGMQAKDDGVKILCLAPTYGRRASLLNNSIACFAAQTHRDKTLLIYDDLGTLKNAHCDHLDVRILSSPKRSRSVGEKYNEMIRYANESGIQYDAVAVWDDDDVYLPMHLETHCHCLQNAKWSKPSRIVSAYFDPPKEETATGRFHGSIAVTRDAIEQVPWIDTTRATFDQEYLSALANHSTPADPCDVAPPQYVYRWQTSQSGHCSGLMGSANWYAEYKPDSREPIDRLWPEFDADTRPFFVA